ncbi:hypothetical protein WN48_08395 [Eufriesea mexicana]|nr:hypothetical protein WN48_08395 [Eufriesea mexicana]
MEGYRKMAIYGVDKRDERRRKDKRFVPGLLLNSSVRLPISPCLRPRSGNYIYRKRRFSSTCEKILKPPSSWNPSSGEDENDGLYSSRDTEEWPATTSLPYLSGPMLLDDGKIFVDSSSQPGFSKTPSNGTLSLEDFPESFPKIRV